MALSIDRRAFIDIINESQGDIGGVMQPLLEGLWGIPEEVLKTLPGYAPDIQKNRAEAHEIMRNLGYCPDRRLQLKVSTRNIPPYRDPAVLLTDQLKEVFVDGSSRSSRPRAGFPRSRARTT
jgi:peptide/nickel transport system substrate-binding protein